MDPKFDSSGNLEHKELYNAIQIAKRTTIGKHAVPVVGTGVVLGIAAKAIGYSVLSATGIGLLAGFGVAFFLGGAGNPANQEPVKPPTSTDPLIIKPKNNF